MESLLKASQNALFRNSSNFYEVFQSIIVSVVARKEPGAFDQGNRKHFGPRIWRVWLHLQTFWSSSMSYQVRKIDFCCFKQLFVSFLSSNRPVSRPEKEVRRSLEWGHHAEPQERWVCYPYQYIKSTFSVKCDRCAGYFDASHWKFVPSGSHLWPSAI